jgi:hypothetical protein
MRRRNDRVRSFAAEPRVEERRAKRTGKRGIAQCSEYDLREPEKVEIAVHGAAVDASGTPIVGCKAGEIMEEPASLGPRSLNDRTLRGTIERS